MLPALVFALLQQPVNYAAPPAGDTTGYWQQRANYTIVATLDEQADALRARATLVYVNNSPDTLVEFYVHQHLNAFRPGSKWSEDDEREGRERFQRLPERAQAYERFTATPTFDGVPVTPEYPGAPDSTVAHFRLPRPLPPGDTLRVEFEWEARPSLLPRRQGRRGRSYDFAQWYPKVAVYDRGGWQANALRPSGEFYGEFGDFDVTLHLRPDQVIGTTGVVTEGDPGWRESLRWGVVARRPDAYETPQRARAASMRAAAPRDTIPRDTTRRDSTRVDSARVDSLRADTTRVDSARADSTRADTTRADSARADSTRADTTRVDSLSRNPVRRDSVRSDTARRAVPGRDTLPREAPRPAADTTPDGYKRLRIVARDVHHFGWSVSPDYRYEGTFYLRPDSVPATRYRVWDSVAVHVLYRPGDESTWGQGQVAARTTTALRWLEELYGPYAYPQMTVLHRIEPGGTEFPMLQMNGSPSQGLILHEGGHVYSYGILANNEWRAGWMDEGLTSYQTLWAQGLTPRERALRPRPARPERPGYAGRGLTPRPEFAGAMQQTALVVQGRAQPLSTVAHEFSEYAVYSAMTYGRGEMLFGALRDALGDEAFRRFLRLYYERWALRHVDEVSMRAAAEAASGRDLGWFFEQWVHETGLTDYALRDVDVRRDGEGWITTVRVEREADYRHPMPVGVRVDTGWVIARVDPMRDEEALSVRTATQPREVRLDPYGTSPDWFAPNDRDVVFPRLNGATTRFVLDWPFLDQSLGSRYVTAFAPMAWYSGPGGLVAGGRLRSNYQGAYDRRELGLALGTRIDPRQRHLEPGVDAPYALSDWSRLHGWYAFENPVLGNGGRPRMGWSGGLWWLDGIALVRLGREWDRSRFLFTGDRVSHSLTLTGSYPYEETLADARRWSGGSATDLTWSYLRRAPAERGTAFRSSFTLGVAAGSGPESDELASYARGELAWSLARASRGGRLSHRMRLYAGAALETPRERGLYLSARTPTETFTNHFYRPDEGILSADDVPFVPLGGAGMRGFDPLADARVAAAINLEEGVRLRRFGPAQRPLDLFATAFADAALQVEEEPVAGGERRTRGLYDAGLGLALRGRIFDREVSWRVDLPLWVSDPVLSVGERSRTDPAERLALRWTFSTGDLW